MPTFIDRPFVIVFGESESVFTLEVEFGFQDLLSEEAKQGILEVISTFEKLGAAGGLGGENIDPGQASLVLNESKFWPHRGRLIFNDVRIDPASTTILLNMIHYIHLEDVPINTVHIDWSGIKFLQEPLSLQFPNQWPRYSFRLDIGELLDDFEVEIKFEENQSENVINQVVDNMSMWLLATHRGAYADETFSPSESAVYLGPDVMDITPDSITWFIDTVRCNESAFDGLLNLLERVHQKIAGIRFVQLVP